MVHSYEEFLRPLIWPSNRLDLRKSWRMRAGLNSHCFNRRKPLFSGFLSFSFLYQIRTGVREVGLIIPIPVVYLKAPYRNDTMPKPSTLFSLFWPSIPLSRTCGWTSASSDSYIHTVPGSHQNGGVAEGFVCLVWVFCLGSWLLMLFSSQAQRSCRN